MSTADDNNRSATAVTEMPVAGEGPDQDWPRDIATLAELLHETAEHHDRFEKAAPAHNWWDWYAAYLNERRLGRTPQQADRAADVYMEKALGITVSA